jgi:glutathione synthase/RimK-type ligase-like ATP-grasp enzyme
MTKPCLGVICTPHGNKTEKNLFPTLRKRFNLILFPVQKDIDYEVLKNQAKDVKVILNTAMDMPNTYDAEEVVKTFETMGKKVIDSSKSFYYKEDKWLFYQTCLKCNLPTPPTWYVPRNANVFKARLKRIMKDGPLVFKGIFSDTGKAVKRAMTYQEALHVIKTLRKKVGLMPVIAQRYIPHGNISYRVTLAGDRIIQSVAKYGKNWKEGKLFWKNEKYKRFKPDKKLVRLCKSTVAAFGLEWCGIDLLKDKEGKWHIIEVNSGPSMDFVISDMNRANKELTEYLFRVNKQYQKN